MHRRVVRSSIARQSQQVLAWEKKNRARFHNLFVYSSATPRFRLHSCFHPADHLSFQRVEMITGWIIICLMIENNNKEASLLPVLARGELTSQIYLCALDCKASNASTTWLEDDEYVNKYVCTPFGADRLVAARKNKIEMSIVNQTIDEIKHRKSNAKATKISVPST